MSSSELMICKKIQVLGFVWSFDHGIRTMMRGGAVIGRRIELKSITGERRDLFSH